MKLGNRVEGALLGVVAMGILGQVPPLTFVAEEGLTIPLGAALGFTFGSSWIKKLKKDLL